MARGQWKVQRILSSVRGSRHRTCCRWVRTGQKSMWVWLPSLVSLWAAEQAFSQRFCHRWRSTPGSCRAWMRQAGFGPSWWLAGFRAAWAAWRHGGCLSNCQGCSEIQRFRAADYQNDGAKRGWKGTREHVAVGWLERCRGSTGEAEDRLEGVWHVVQGTAMTKAGWQWGAVSDRTSITCGQVPGKCRIAVWW